MNSLRAKSQDSRQWLHRFFIILKWLDTMLLRLLNPVCPYCKSVQNPPPEHKKKCQHCGQIIHVYKPRPGKKRLVTQEAFQKLIQKSKEKQDRQRRLEQMKKEKAKVEKERQRQKKQEIRLRQQQQAWDIRKKELKKMIREASLSKRQSDWDWQKLAQAYMQLESILRAEGKDHFEAAQFAKVSELKTMQSVGIRKVEILTSDDERVCPHCQSLAGKIMSVRRAIDQMPLPPDNCKHCRCIYMAVN